MVVGSLRLDPATRHVSRAGVEIDLSAKEFALLDVFMRHAGRVLSQQDGRTLDLLTTQDNITAGVLLLRQLLRSTGSTDRALAGYYQGLGSIARQGILPQTRSYIRSITLLRSRFTAG